MKRFYTNLRHLFFLTLTSIAILSDIQSIRAQGCNQVEIEFEQPDCYKRKGNDGGPSGQERGCKGITVCEQQSYPYSATGGPWASYLWAITSGPAAPPISPNATVADVNITWPVPGTYVLTLTVTDANGNVFTKCIEVTVKERPNAAYTFTPNNACAGSTINFLNGTTYSGTAYYSWDFGDPTSGSNNFSNLTNPSHQYAVAGSYTVTLIAYSSILVPNNNHHGGDSMTLVTCCADTVKHTVTVLNGNVKIECISTVCAGTKATYTAVGCSTAAWGAPIGGTVISTTANTITVQWGNGNLQGQLSVTCGGCTAYASVPIIPTTPVIVGSASPCISGQSSYSLPYLPGTFYTWTLTDVTSAINANNLLSTYPDNNTVWVDWPQAVPGDTYQLTISLNNPHLCCSSTGSLTIKPKQVFSINGQATICAGATAGFFPNQADTFFWTATPAIAVAPPLLGGAGFYSASFSNPGNYVITATNTTAFCNTTATLNVVVVPVPVPDTIVGPVAGCNGSQYAYAMSGPAPTGYYYEWSITGGTFEPGGLTVTTGNNVNVLWASLPGTITVTLKKSGAPFCNKFADAITVVPATVGSVSGLDSVCVDGTAVYTLSGGNTPPGTSVVWSITPASLGTIIAGQGTNNVTILWHGQGGTGPWGPAIVNATTGCGPAGPSAPITIFPKFLLNITSSTSDICQSGGLALSANAAPAGASYLWTPGAVTTQTYTNITTPGAYTVLASAAGCSNSAQFIVPDPFAILPLTCGVGFCSGLATNEVLGVQVIKPASGTFTYEWHSGTCTSPGPILATTTTTTLNNSFTATSDGNYCVIVKYGNCQKCVDFVVRKVCCPDVNTPSATATQNSCDTWTFIGTGFNPANGTITWNFGDNTTDTGSFGTPKTHTYAAAGIYCVTFCVGPPTPNPTNCSGNCAATQAIVPIAPNFNYTLGCNGCLNLTNLTAIYDNGDTIIYTWNFGDATTSNLPNPPPHCYISGGTYTVSLSVTWIKGAISCTKSVSQNVVYVPLKITVSDTCSGTPITFSSTPGGFVSYTWAFGDTYTGYVSPIVHAYNAAGTYQVNLTVIDVLGNTCKDSSSLNIQTGISNCTIKPGYICPGGSATLSAQSGPYTYQWLFESSPNTFTSAPGTGNDSNYTTNIVGNYQVVLTNANGCKCTSNVVSVTAVSNPGASFTISPSKKLCAPGDLVTATAPFINGFTYEWYLNSSYGTPVSTSSTYFAFVSTTTMYNLVVTNQYGCKDTCSMLISVAVSPAPPLITATGLCAGVPITLAVTNYAGNISWNNGANSTSIVVFNAGTYIATYTDTITGCSTSSTITVNKRPGAGLFPHSCDSIPCKCTRPFVLYAPNPLMGAFASGYGISWYNANTNTFLATGPTYNNGGSGVQTGSYYVIIVDSVTGCKDTSNSYSVVVPKCDTCNCEKSNFAEIILKNSKPADGGAGIIKLECGETYKIDCSKPYVIKPLFKCSDTACKGKITYTLQPPGGAAVTGSDSVVFTPVLNGTYTLTVYGWCGNKVCDSCVVKFKVKCVDCCKGSKWGPIVLSGIDDPANPAKSAVTINNPPDGLKCGKIYKLDCNKHYSIAAAFKCKDSTCPAKVTYSLQPPTGLPVTGNAPLNFTPTLAGTYVLTLYGWCGNSICDSCRISFEVICGCDCAKSKFKDINLTTGIHDGGGDPATITTVPNPVSQKLQCNKDYNLDCKKTYSVNAGFLCKDSICTSAITYALKPPTGPILAGTVPFSFSPVLSGTYTLTIYGWCGTKVCDSCVIRFKVDCACDCNGSKWAEKTLNNGSTTTALTCKNYQWKCNQPIGINASYNCTKDFCEDTSTYKLIPPSGPAVTGNLPLSFVPATSGTYIVTIYGYCGGKICDSCVSTYKVECPKDTECCKHQIKVEPGTVKYTSTSTATIASQSFAISGLTGVQLTEVRAEVLSYTLTNANGDCDIDECCTKNLPFHWASINSAGNIGTVPGLVNLYGSTTALFNGTGAQAYMNPREVIWNNGSIFMISAPISIKFFLPPIPSLECCELKGRICVKFTFRDVNCKECEWIACFDIGLK